MLYGAAVMRGARTLTTLFFLLPVVQSVALVWLPWAELPVQTLGNGVRRNRSV